MSSTVENPRLVRMENTFARGPEWRVDAILDGRGGTLTLSRNLTWSNSFSVNADVKREQVSVGVKFDVTRSESVIAMRAVEVPEDVSSPPKVLRLEAGTREEVHAFDVQGWDCLGQRRGPPTVGYARKFDSLVYNSSIYESGP